MARRLPWKRPEKSNSDPGNAAQDDKDVDDAKPNLPTSPRVPVRTPTTKRIETPSRNPLAPARSPSTSPPPEPPPESLMIPGPLNDDKYRMVEDEFLSTAQLYTAHLHRAEYNRLKTMAKTHNAAAIREIERPVVGSPTKLARQRRDAFKRVQKQRDQLGPENEESAPRMSSGLRGLMDSPSKENKFIRPFPKVTSTTRAAAGFSSRSLGPSVVGAGRKSLAEKRRVPTGPGGDPEDNDLSPSLLVRGSASKPSTKKTAVRPTKQTHYKENKEDDDDEDDPFGIQKRRIRREKSREQLRRTAKPQPTTSPDVIPTFL